MTGVTRTASIALITAAIFTLTACAQPDSPVSSHPSLDAPSPSPSDAWVGTGFTREDHEAAREDAQKVVDGIAVPYSLGDATCGVSIKFGEIGPAQPGGAFREGGKDGWFPIDLNLNTYHLGKANLDFYDDQVTVATWWTGSELIWADEPPAYVDGGANAKYWQKCVLGVTGTSIR